MDTFRRILFPVDLSESSDKLVPTVTTMVRKFDAELHLLFVVRILRYFTDIYVPHPSINLFESEMVEGAQKKMEEFKQTLERAVEAIMDFISKGLDTAMNKHNVSN